MKKKAELAEEIEYIADVIEKGIEKHAHKHEQSKIMNQIAKDAAEQTTAKKASIVKMKDYMHYRGRGWGSDALDKSDEKEKFPDRVSPTFRHVEEIVRTMYECGMPEMLDVYTSALKARGIDLNIDKRMFLEPTSEEREIIRNAVEAMQPYQTCICEENDYMTDVLAVAAEKQRVTPKQKYKKIVQLAWKKSEGRDIDDNIQDELLLNDIYSDSLVKLFDSGKAASAQENNEE